MNILVLGNGFDLAHGLPTKYTDFLEWAKIIDETICDIKSTYHIDEFKVDSFKKEIIKVGEFGKVDVAKQQIDIEMRLFASIKNIRIREYIIKILKLWGNKEVDLINELHYLLHENIWIEYFLNNEGFNKENWIDFESEISSVIRVLDEARVFTENEESVTSIEQSSKMNIINNIVHAARKKYDEVFSSVKAIDKFTELLEEDLKKIIRALEIYLNEFVEETECNIVSPDIEKILQDINENGQLNKEEFKVISFNYTNTFEKVYDKCMDAEYDYIHGKADIKNTILSNNMVLGIDEYLLDDRKNKDVEFIYFKKYFQRIHKQTGCKYKKWIEEIRDDWETRNEYEKLEISEAISEEKFQDIKGWGHRLYIFGHSLDDTDKDILRDLVENDNIHTTVYYHEEKNDNGTKDLKGKIANLVKVIGQDELIKRTGGSTKTISFKLQKEMVANS